MLIMDLQLLQLQVLVVEVVMVKDILNLKELVKQEVKVIAHNVQQET